MTEQDFNDDAEFEIDPDFDEPDKATGDANEAKDADETFDDDFAEWWAHTVPDFLWPNYPFDVPPGRLAFATRVMTMAGAPRHCPEPACHRARKCRGGDGPPCYRADRENLQQVLFLAWAKLVLDFSDEEIAAALTARGSRYQLFGSAERRDAIC
jgi:hypothetical protein